MQASQNGTITEFHPNGKQITHGRKRPKRFDEPFFQEVFPDNPLGKLLQGLSIMYLIKQEHRMGWARKSACDDTVLNQHPNETVASHQWGVAALIMAISREPQFQEELPHFDRLKAIEMSLIHDVPELVIGDITPVDGISTKEKHAMERKAMDQILGFFSASVRKSIDDIYEKYEQRQCIESKFVKDCDKLDFMLHAFLLERQGFTSFQEFYSNSLSEGFNTKIASELAKILKDTRDDLKGKNKLYIRQS